MNVVGPLFAIARRRLSELTSDSLQSREKVTGAPYAVTGCREHRSIFAGSNLWVYSSYWNYYETDFDTAS